MLTHDPSVFSLMAADHGVIIIITVHHKITNKTAGAVLRGHGGLLAHSGSW